MLLAVSGGPDSVALLLGTAEVAAALHLQPEVACVDHGLRPESQEEVRRVGALAAGLGLPFHPLPVPIAHGPGAEARAREARYEALERARAGRRCRWIATAHTASDQAETLLMRLLRGTSVKGARGIHAARGAVLRPMLGATRGEVMAFLQERGADRGLADDAMNRDPAFLRVRVRHEVLPALAAAAQDDPAEVVRRLARFASFAAEDEALLGGMATDALARLQLPEPAGALDAPGLRALHPAVRRRALSHWLREAGLPVSAAKLERLEWALRSGRKVEVGKRRQALVAGGALRLTQPPRAAAQVPAPPAPLTPGNPVAYPASGQVVVLDRAPMPDALAVLPLSRLPDRPLEVRTRRPGDRVRAGGGRRRKLQDALVDLKVPAERRDGLLLVAEEGGDVVWIVGFWPRSVAAACPEWYLSARALYNRGEPSKGRPCRL
jgi:tRNA(Ile)-lysidine synthase